MTTFYKSSDDDDKTVMISLEKDKKKMLSTNSSQKMFKNILLKENVFAKISAKMFLLLSCFTENVYKIKMNFSELILEWRRFGIFTGPTNVFRMNILGDPLGNFLDSGVMSGIIDAPTVADIRGTRARHT